jgi:hypothetical protein
MLTTCVFYLRTFQEHFLSPRTIFFGKQSLMWECSEVSRDEWLGIVGIDHRGSLPKTRLYKELSVLRCPIRSIPDNLSGSHILGVWSSLIQEYRTRNLSEADDRIIAFADIARATQSITRLTYLAGLWAEYMSFCLLWRV